MSVSYRVFRSGSWNNDGATSLAARARFRYAPSLRLIGLGFRCARWSEVSFCRVLQGGGSGIRSMRWRAVSRGHGVPGIRNYDIVLRCTRRAQ